jgi:signal transduction histidine kinase
VLHNALTMGLDKKRLRWFLSFFFLALAIPTGFLIWQAYSQLKWEAFHQYRGMAEEQTRRIDASVIALINSMEANTFADYAFFVVTGDPSANFLQRSTLSNYPISEQLPGLLGHFQIGSAGEFSTPILPQGNRPPAVYGIPESEYAQRRELAEKIRTILGDNKLVEYRPSDTGFDIAAVLADGAASGAKLEESIEPEISEQGLPFDSPGMPPTTSPAELAKHKENRNAAALRPSTKAPPRQNLDSQLAFDKLNMESSLRDEMTNESDYASPERIEVREYESKLGRVEDLKLDESYQKKSFDLEQGQLGGQRKIAQSEYVVRGTRKEKISLPEPVEEDVGQFDDSEDSFGLEISTFESEIDPLEFSLLDSGHIVLFRKVWRDEKRYIQGMLIDQRSFIEETIDLPFQETALSAMSDLVVAYQDNVLHRATGSPYGSYVRTSTALDGNLLFRNRLSAPLDGIELIYSVNHLPAGPGAEVLVWISLVLGLVFCGGFYGIHRMGLSQISLVQQQQDFVSSVSHELKTPLTSIRMYGEMLKEGWASDEKKQQYYEFIHDESERLARLISNVLQLASLTRNEPPIEMKTVSVGELMMVIESKISGQVERAGFSLDIDCDPEIAVRMIVTDQDCFAQIIINLVDNAIKFSRGAAKNSIEIRCRSSGSDKIAVLVRDHGPGIARDQMRKIFDMFYRTESELTRETVGTGIGLAIVHRLGVTINAEVDVVNKDPGAEFRIVLPLLN